VGLLQGKGGSVFFPEFASFTRSNRYLKCPEAGGNLEGDGQLRDSGPYSNGKASNQLLIGSLTADMISKGFFAPIKPSIQFENTMCGSSVFRYGISQTGFCGNQSL